MDAASPAGRAIRPVCNPAENCPGERDQRGRQKETTNVPPGIGEAIVGSVHHPAARVDATQAAHPGPHDRPGPLTAGGIPGCVGDTGAPILLRGCQLSRSWIRGGFLPRLKTSLTWPRPLPQNRTQNKGLQGLTLDEVPVQNEMLGYCRREQGIDRHGATNANVERHDAGRAEPEESGPGLRTRLRVAAWTAQDG